MMSCLRYVLVYWYFSFVWVKSDPKPNLIVIVADDLGWNDVGFHGSNQIPTPNIDAVAYNGIVLNRHYTLPVCTPSRVALMTGKYPIRTGLQGNPRSPLEPWALPIQEKILPQYLKEQGYRTHLIGKWHLGFYKTEFTPTRRGFDSHFGYYNGWIRYNDSVSISYPNASGIDARRDLQHAGHEFAGKYATDVFTNEAVNIIKNHDQNNPLFLELSHVAVHAIKGDTLQVRDEKQNDQDFGYIVDKERRLLAGTLKALDESVGEVIKALKETNMLQNSVFLFVSDNGGATEDLDWHFRNSASNWPLRGMKTSLFDGGVRGAAAIWSPLFAKKNYVSNELFHITDWLPTFLAAAGGDPKKIQTIDGINQWDLLTGKTTKTARQEILINIDPDRNNSAIISETWKLISNDKTHQFTFADKYAGVPGREETPPYDLNKVLSSTTNRIISNEPSSTSGSLFLQIREQAKLDSKCSTRISNSSPSAECHSDCLYDLENDPCEFSNIAESHPQVVTQLKNRLSYFQSITVPPIQTKRDPKANPIYWQNYWSCWLDNEITNNASSAIRGILVISVTLFICKKVGNFLIIV